jgi:hypothetical protein
MTNQLRCNGLRWYAELGGTPIFQLSGKFFRSVEAFGRHADAGFAEAGATIP